MADVLPFDEFSPLGLTHPGTQLLTIGFSETDREGALVCNSFAWKNMGELVGLAVLVDELFRSRSGRPVERDDPGPSLTMLPDRDGRLGTEVLMPKALGVCTSSLCLSRLSCGATGLEPE